MPKKKTDPAITELDRLFDHLQVALELVNEETPGGAKAGTLPLDLDVMKRACRRFSERMNPAPTRAHQKVMKNVLRMLSEKANTDASAALSMLNDAFDATEDLAIRSAYIVGMGVGMDFGLGQGKLLVEKQSRRRKSASATKRVARTSTARGAR